MMVSVTVGPDDSIVVMAMGRPGTEGVIYVSGPRETGRLAVLAGPVELRRLAAALLEAAGGEG